MYEYQYILEPYKGIKSRYTCPACNRAKKYTRYFDLYEGKYLPFEYGRCDREQSCGYHLNPYKDSYHIKKSGRGQISSLPRSFHSKKKKSSIKIPYKIFEGSLTGYDNNMFIRYLNELVGASRTQQLIERFYIGTSDFWQGSTVFWLIDEDMRIAGGQVILFDEFGRTRKEEKADGNLKRYNSWVHTALKYDYKKKNSPLPRWLSSYINDSPKFPCLFGLPQLKNEPITKPIAIVEAAKTAVIATAFLPQYIWLAVGALSYLNEERIKILRRRNITLFPDKGAYDKWKIKAIQFNQFTNVNISDLLERKQALKGSDLADYLVKIKPETLK